MSVSTGRYAGLDVLRLIAATSVMLFHLAFWTWANDQAAGTRILDGAVAYPALTQVAWFGNVGVPIFFVISGFVIAFSANRNTAMGFFRSRVLRLAPAALICATITLAVMLLDGTFPTVGLLHGYVRSVLFIPVAPWIDNVYWTLGIEIAFYAFVFAHLLIGRFRWFEWSVTLLGLWSWSAIAMNMSGLPVGRALVEGRYGQLALAAHGVYFALGALIWVVAHRGATPRRVGLIAAFIVAGAVPIWTAGVHRTEHFAHLGLNGWSALWPPFFWLAGVATIIASVRFDRPMPKWGPRIAIVGLATYPLYLIHYRVGAAAMKLLLHLGLGQYAALVIAMASMFALAVFITRYPEKQLRGLIAPPLSALVVGNRRGTVTAFAPRGTSDRPEDRRSQRP